MKHNGKTLVSCKTSHLQQGMQQQWVRKTLENLCAMQGIQRVY